MDTGQIVTLVGFSVGIFAVLFGIAALMWQINHQSSRVEAKIDMQGKELREEMKAQGKELEAKIDTQGKELEAKIDMQGKGLREEMKAHGARVSQAELDQARMNGVNSVLLRQTHTHEHIDSAD